MATSPTPAALPAIAERPDPNPTTTTPEQTPCPPPTVPARPPQLTLAELGLLVAWFARLLPNELPDLSSIVVAILAAAGSPPPERLPRLSKQEALVKALLLRQQHPDWPHARIAEAVGRSVRQLYRWREYMDATRLERPSPRRHLGAKDRHGWFDVAEPDDDDVV